MKEKLIIKNFGPIKSVDLDLGKITVLIGEQATGKSTIAKILSMCRYFSYIVNYVIDIDKQNEFHTNEQFFNGLKDWGIDDYLQDESEIFYRNELYAFEFKNKLVTEYETVVTIDDLKKQYYLTETKISSNSTIFTKLLKELENLKKDEEASNRISEREVLYAYEGGSWTPNENFYRLNAKKVMDNPLFIPAERGFQSLSVGKDSLVSDAIQDELFKINRIVRGYKKETQIKPLSIVYKNINNIGYVKKIKDKEFFTLHNGASGYQSTIPIVLAVKYYNEVERRKRTFIVEEPEINLFPSVQRKLMSFFVENINNNGHSFLIPTHSPYFLSAINDLLIAYKKGQQNEKETGKVIKEDAWLNPTDLSVYELKNGEADDIFDKNLGLISDNIIDDVSDEMNEEFERLLDIK
jgi:predicted ATPase